MHPLVQDLFLYCMLVPDDSLHCTALSGGSLIIPSCFLGDDFFLLLLESKLQRLFLKVKAEA